MRSKRNLSTVISVFSAIVLMLLIGLPNPNHSLYDNSTATSQLSVTPLQSQQKETEELLNENSMPVYENMNQAERIECEKEAIKEYQSDFCLETLDNLNSKEMLTTYFDQCATTVSFNQYDCHCNFPLAGETECNQNPCMATLEKCEMAAEQIYESCLSLVGRTIDGTSITNSYCSNLHENSLAQECEAEYAQCKG